MGVMKQLKEAKKGSGLKKPTRNSNSLYVYKPTEQDRNWLKANQPKLEVVIEELGLWMARGNKLSLGQALDNGSFYAILREPGDDWRSSRAIGMFSTSILKAVTLLYFYLMEVNPEWPEGTEVVVDEPFDW